MAARCGFDVEVNFAQQKVAERLQQALGDFLERAPESEDAVAAILFCQGLVQAVVLQQLQEQIICLITSGIEASVIDRPGGIFVRSAEQISMEVESVGGSIDSFGGNNSFGLTMEVLSGDLKTGLDVFADVLLHPAFPDAPFERERRIQLESIRAQRDQLLQSCGHAMRRVLFGDIGYGLDSSGTQESVQAIRLADLGAFHQKLVAPENCVLAVFGDIHAGELKAALQKHLARWDNSAPAALPRPQPPPLIEIKRVTETRDKSQAVLVLGFCGTTLLDEDRYPLELLQEGCSDLGSRLFLRVREKLGLAYYVGAQNFLGLAPGYFAFYVGTAPEKLADVEKELLAEAELLRAGGLTEEELRRAKAKVIGQRKISRQDLGGYAISVALNEVYGLGYEYFDTEDARYEAVTSAQVRAVAQKYLTPAAVVIAVIKPG